MDIALFPGAGSFGGEFQPLIDAFRPASWLVRYPGRAGRDFGVPAESLDAVVEACAGQVTERMATAGQVTERMATAGQVTVGAAATVLIGHSFGAYVAYLTAVRLERAGSPVTALVTVGADAPALLDVPVQATGTPADAAAYLARVDPGALADAPSDDWRDIVTETVVQDMRLLTEFDTTASARLRCLITAVRGDADPLTSDAGIAGWRRHTSATFAARTFPGGHSDLLRTPGYLSWIRDVCGGAVGD